MGPLEGLNPSALWPVVAVGFVALVLGVLLARSRSRAARALEGERQRAAGLERRLTGVLVAGRDGIVLHSPTGRVIGVNEAAAAVLDAAPSALVGLDVSQLPVQWVSDAGQPVAPGGGLRPTPGPPGLR